MGYCLNEMKLFQENLIVQRYLSDRYLIHGVLISIAHVIGHANFQLYKTYTGRIISKNRQMMTNT